MTKKNKKLKKILYFCIICSLVIINFWLEFKKTSISLDLVSVESKISAKSEENYNTEVILIKNDSLTNLSELALDFGFVQKPDILYLNKETLTAQIP